jgi:alkanesulfonate monooxygenase SsuD/methylene tetrahydromethanopterin reductase-like flavin-dependent oxidoreductase (luciferase family)
MDLDYWVQLARTAERGKRDGILLTNILGVYDVYRQRANPVATTAVQLLVNDPMIAISDMVYAAEHLGFDVSVNTSYEAPFLLARCLSTLLSPRQGA